MPIVRVVAAETTTPTSAAAVPPSTRQARKPRPVYVTSKEAVNPPMARNAAWPRDNSPAVPTRTVSTIAPIAVIADRIADRKRVVKGKSVSERVDRGGRRIQKKKRSRYTHDNKIKKNHMNNRN